MNLRNYFSLVRFSHTIFALPFALIGFMLAYQHNDVPFRVSTLLLVVGCMVTARSAAMAFNRYADRHIDKLNPRTAGREIPAGKISPGAALLFVIISSAFFMIFSWLLNPLCFLLSPVALLVVLGYSYTKRFTMLCHLVLGLGLALAPIGAYLAVAGRFDWLPILFSACVLCWVSGFDIIYALQDDNFDRQHKMHSIPAMLGRRSSLGIAMLLHVAAAACLLAAGWLGNFGFWYWAGAAIFTALLVNQHRLVKPDNLSKVDLAFFTNNGIASIVLFLATAADFLVTSAW